MKGDYDTAITWLNDALKEAEHLKEPSKIKPARSLALINLGLAFWLSHKYDQSFKILCQAKQEREEVLGPNDRQSMMYVIYSVGIICSIYS